MKKTLLLITFLAVCAAAVAAPKNQLQSLAADIWYLVGGTVTANSVPATGENLLDLQNNGSRKVHIGPEGGVAIGGEWVDYWFNENVRRYFVSIANLETEPADAGYVGFYSEVFDMSQDIYSGAYMDANRFGANFGMWGGDSSVWGIASPDQARIGISHGTFEAALTKDGVIAGGQPWKLGQVVPSVVSLNTNKYVLVIINGQAVKLAIVE
jgi:hypothetical protein